MCFCHRAAQQGFDAACKAILECVGGNTQAALQLFPKWAVPVAWLTMNDYDEGKRAIEPVSIDPVGIRLSLVRHRQLWPPVQAKLT